MAEQPFGHLEYCRVARKVVSRAASVPATTADSVSVHACQGSDKGPYKEYRAYERPLHYPAQRVTLVGQLQKGALQELGRIVGPQVVLKPTVEVAEVRHYAPLV